MLVVHRFFLSVSLLVSSLVLNLATAQTSLRFPLKDGLTPDNAPISSAFDHSMADGSGLYALYGKTDKQLDDTVVSYTNERGEAGFNDQSAIGREATKELCYSQYSTEPFRINGNYVGLSKFGEASRSSYLCYDNHPGIDYAVGVGTKVYAAASGTVHYPDSMVGLRYGKSAYIKNHALELRSQAYKIHYLHLSTHPNTKTAVVVEDTTGGNCPRFVTLPLPEGAPVEAGCLIALSGDAGAPAHLHFDVQKIVPINTVPPDVQGWTRCPNDGHTSSTQACVPVDPYGWESPSPDPYAALTGFVSQRLWGGAGWTRVFPNDQPTARVMFAMAYDEARGQVVLFGGYDVASPTGGAGPVDDTWIWENGNWRQWRRGLFDQNPPPMWGHSMVYDALRQKIVLFGGNIAGNATWLWDGNGWEEVPYNALWPPYRAGQAMAYDWSRGEVVLQGGQAHASTGYFGWNDTWVWNGYNWIERLPITSPVPNWRHMSAMAWDPVSRKVIRFGGRSISCGGGCYAPITHDDTWMWDGTSWQEVTGLPPGGPLPREGHAMAIAPGINRVILVGGSVLVSTYPHTYEQRSDTWIWTGSSWSLAQPSNPALRTGAKAFDIAPDLWNGQVLLFTTPEPGVRETWVWK